MLEKLLGDLIPAKYRKLVYLILLLALLAFGAWQAAEGDWTNAVIGFVSAIGHALANGNTFSTGGDLPDIPDPAPAEPEVSTDEVTQ